MRPPLLLLLTASLAGCASIEPGKGFDQVSSAVSERTPGHPQVRWDHGSAADIEANTAVEQLLSRELTMEAAVQVALLNNRGLRAEYNELDIAQAELVEAGLLHNPVFSGEVRFETGGGGTGVVLDVAQDFLSLLWMPLLKSRAGVAVESAKVRVTASAVGVAYDTASAYYAHVAAEETAALRTHVEHAAAASLALAQRLREAGNTREIDLLGEQALYEQARLDAEEARAAVHSTRERLNVLMGAWGKQTAWHTPARLPDLPTASEDPSPEDLERRAVASSLELAEARLAVDLAASDPTLSSPFSWLSGTEVGAAAEREVEGGWSVGPSLSIPIPIFNTGAAAQTAAGARARQAADRYYAAAVQVRAQSRAAAAALAFARTRAERLRTVVLPLHERLVNATQLQYNAMQVSGFQLLQAKRNQIEAGVSSVEALRDYWTARTGLDRALGGARPPEGRQDEPRQDRHRMQPQGDHR